MIRVSQGWLPSLLMLSVHSFDAIASPSLLSSQQLCASASGFDGMFGYRRIVRIQPDSASIIAGACIQACHRRPSFANVTRTPWPASIPALSFSR